MAEPAYDYNRFYGNAAPETFVKQKKKTVKKPELKKLRPTAPSATWEQHSAVMKKVASVSVIIAVVAVFFSAALWALFSERQLAHNINDLKEEYNIVHAQLDTLKAGVESKITAAVVADYAETKLGMIKVPDSNKIYSDTGSQNGVINE